MKITKDVSISPYMSDISTTTAVTPTVNTLGVPSAQELMVYQTWAKTAVDSQMYRGIGKESGVMMIMLAAREFGIGPAQALNGGLKIIEGNVVLSARIMDALIRRAKHSMKIVESTATKCVIYGKRRDTGDDHTAEFTIEEAKLAGLVREKSGWAKYPKDMCYARALTRLARELFPDVIGIGYIEGEIEEKGTVDITPPCQSIKVEPMYANIIYSFINEEDTVLMDEFIEKVRSHYKWTYEETVKHFCEDTDDTIKKFNTWKEGKKK